MLDELEEKILYTLRSMTTGSRVQDLSKQSKIMLNYKSVLNDTIEMVANLDELENKLKVSWQNK